MRVGSTRFDQRLAARLRTWLRHSISTLRTLGVTAPEHSDHFASSTPSLNSDVAPFNTLVAVAVK